MKTLHYALLPLIPITFASAQLNDLPTTWLDADGFEVELDQACVVGANQVSLGAITIDGDLSDWYEAGNACFANGFNHMTITDQWGIPPTAPLPNAFDCSGVWQAFWDSQFLYIAVQVTDDLVASESYFQSSDGIEIFIDGDFSHSAGIAWNQPGQDYINDWHKIIRWDGDVANGLYDASSLLDTDLDMDVATALTETGYNIELKIRITSINSDLLTAEVGSYLGFDIRINDTDEANGSREAAINWCSELNDNFANPALFGVLVLTSNEDDCSAPCTYDCPREIFCPCYGDETNSDYYSGLGWLSFVAYSDEAWYVYSYSLEAWLWMGPQENFSRFAFWSYDLTHRRWLWGNSNWGYFYDLSSGEWLHVRGLLSQ